MHTTRHVLFGLLGTILVAALAGCGALGECNDCGECGIAGGPNPESRLGGSAVGTDDAGVPTVELVPFLEGECLDDGAQALWVQFDDGAVTQRAPGENEELDRDAAEPRSTGPGPNVYDVAGAEGVTVTLDRDADGVDVTFSDGTVEVELRCELAADETVACEEL
jgi:hypothetical protein